jgi:hypothetical protein
MELTRQAMSPNLRLIVLDRASITYEYLGT